ncbi:leucyl aminopeptidase family protein [Natronospira bacteriovora]|uniref:Leucyl aminopeptidase family protein n=1 Tax=Natronospira bacteriovora TaxID=3069753 RepID=A0ABU0W5K7_9GAMM|nr:leucyl aminopeptidase family protein [Natronospira sp. AB-CW4]MDQ2069224.1 leucyl aminopeptidase family protein [Natronospira sp. AB-CW4]
MFVDSGSRACPIIPLDGSGLTRWLASAEAAHSRWVGAHDFQGKAGEYVVIPGTDGQPEMILLGVENGERLWSLAGLPDVLPAGDYRLDADWPDAERIRASLGWGLACHRFDQYKEMKTPKASLVLPEAIRDEVEVLLEASTHVRDLVNTPAIDLGPAELAATAQEIAGRFGAEFRLYQGAELEEQFPAVHVVGQAASRPPCLACFQWGEPNDPPLALVGKGVVFDSGGLNIKPGAGMVLMKKDMGGAAHVLGLAEIIMALGLKVNLRVYIPAVENAIAGNAYRPSDIIRTRNGTTVEIGNTDAEGRVILSDALTLACEEGAERVIDFATLTGAARIALGEDLPPLYGRDAISARGIQDLSFAVEDPLWHMPLYRPYKRQIQPALADLSNTGTTPQGGSLTAALFLDHFVDEKVDWYHLDVYAWNLGDRPGRPAGGEAQGVRAMWYWLKEQYGVK